jgi:hypothetical protein
MQQTVERSKVIGIRWQPEDLRTLKRLSKTLAKSGAKEPDRTKVVRFALYALTQLSEAELIALAERYGASLGISR